MKAIPESVREELAALAEKSDEDIDLSDIPATTHEDWANAVRGKFYRPDAQYKYKLAETRWRQRLPKVQ